MQLPLYNSNRTMQLLNKTCKVPKINEGDGKVHLKFFGNSWTWFLMELDLETGEAFGKVFSAMCPEGELGYFSMQELAELKLPPFNHAIERDRYFDPMPLEDIRNPCGV